MELNELNDEQLKELVIKTEDKDALREIADHLEVTYSGNTGLQKLKDNVLAQIEANMETPEDDEPEMDPDLNVNDPVAQALMAQIKEKAKEDDVHVKHERITYSNAEMMEMDAAQVKDEKLRKAVIRAQALRLRRVRITNNDPADAEVPGTIVSVISKYTGKVAKFIPYEEEMYEKGYHVPQIIIDDLESRTYNVRRKVKSRAGQFGVPEYKTVKQRKFIIEYLRDLTPDELKALAREQNARNAIDRSNAN